MEKVLSEYYSLEDLESLKAILRTAPLYTVLRVNTLKCSKDEAKLLLSNHFISAKEPFIVEENEDFPEILMIKAIGPNHVSPAAKGNNTLFYVWLLIKNHRNYCRLF